MSHVCITGSTDGIGRDAARRLLQDGHRVLIHGRSRERCEQAAAYLLDQCGQAAAERIGTVVADFASLHQVRQMAKEIGEKHASVNVLLCNAGVLLPQRQVSNDGVEMTVQVNHLAHFLLCNELLGALAKNAPARIVIVSSICHEWHPLAWDDMESANGYDKYEQYSRTKLMNVMHALALAKRAQGSGVTVNALEPGVIQTKLLAAGGYSGAPVSRGSAVERHCCVAPALAGRTGLYVDVDCKVARPSDWATDADMQERLWQWSAAMCDKALK